MAMAMAITIPIYAYNVHNSHSYCDYIVQLKHLKCHRAPGLQYRRRVTRPCAGNFDNNSEADTAAQVSVSDPLQDDLAAKLAAAEAEAKALRRELAARRGDREVDLSKLKLAAPEKRIDGTGYRETLFSTPDSNSVRLQLKKRFDSGDISKDTFLSAAGYLEGADAELASSTTYAIFDYLNQADYNKYFEYMGQPSISQQLEFLKFSLQSIKAAREQVDKFLSLIPKEELDAAQAQIIR